jgi:thioredoxin-like negative regulator of GroEL
MFINMFISYSGHLLGMMNKETAKGGVMHVKDGEFEAIVLKSDVPVLVDFYADWCVDHATR